jgi:hypothetical protein
MTWNQKARWHCWQSGNFCDLQSIGLFALLTKWNFYDLQSIVLFAFTDCKKTQEKSELKFIWLPLNVFFHKFDRMDIFVTYNQNFVNVSKVEFFILALKSSFTLTANYLSDITSWNFTLQKNRLKSLITQFSSLLVN